MYNQRIVENLFLYLSRNNWKELKTQYSGLKVFNNPDYENLKVILPRTPESPDYQERVDDAIELLSKLGNNRKEIFINLLDQFIVDFHNYRVPGKDIPAVPLNLAEEIISSSKRIIYHAAQEEYNNYRDLFIKEKRSKLDISKEYVDQCKFGHTWKGSFGFTIEAPLNPKSIGLFNDPIPSYERKISKRIHVGMKIIKEAEQLRSENFIVDNIEIGFNVKMLSEILAIADAIKFNKIEYSTTWAPVLPVEKEYSRTEEYSISHQTFNWIEKAVSKLKVEDDEQEILFFGFPEGLKSPKEQLLDKKLEGNRFISVRGVSEGIKETVLKLELSYTDYLKAVHAHENHKDLKVRCIVRKKPRGWDVIKIKKFEIAE